MSNVETLLPGTRIDQERLINHLRLQSELPGSNGMTPCGLQSSKYCVLPVGVNFLQNESCYHSGYWPPVRLIDGRKEIRLAVLPTS